VQGKLWLDTRQDTPELRLFAQANRLPLQRVPALREVQLSGEADVSLLVYGRLDTPTVEANLRMDALRYANQRIGGLRARVQYADGALTIPLATLQGALGAVYLSGELRDLTSDNPRFDLSIDASEVDLNLLAQLLGDANGADESLRLDGDRLPHSAGARQSPIARSRRRGSRVRWARGRPRCGDRRREPEPCWSANCGLHRRRSYAAQHN
jgi:hypothetical protein